MNFSSCRVCSWWLSIGCICGVAMAWPPSQECEALANQFCDDHCQPTLLPVCNGSMKAVIDYGTGCAPQLLCVAPFAMRPSADHYEASTCFCDEYTSLKKLFQKCGTSLPPPAPCPAPPPPLNGSHFVDVFVAGEQDKHGTTYACFRIPAMVRTKSGRILAFAEGRSGNCADHGDVRIVLRFSDDVGKTWSPIHIVHAESGHTIGNPAPVVDNTTGVVHLLFSRDNKEVYTSSSYDSGETWTSAVNQTATLKPTTQHDLWVATGPPGGIQLGSGRLIVGAYYNSPKGKTGAYAIFSDDHGTTWQRAADVGYGDTAALGECQIAQVKGGKLAMFIRAKPADATAKQSQHAVAISEDEGLTWRIPARMLPQLQGPSCQGSVTISPYGGLYVSAPLGDASARKGMTVYSLDENGGRPGLPLYIFWKGPAAYSSMISTHSTSSPFFILFERGVNNPYERLTFASSEWSPPPSPPPPSADLMHI